MLKLKNVSKYYYQDGVIAEGFRNVNLELHLGEFVVITGESGSGKSTLLNVLSGLDTYEDGEMYICGEETSHYREEDYLDYRRKYVSNIFQNFNLVNSYTVYENIELALLMNGKKKREIRPIVNDLIKKVGLTKYRNTHTSKLSGGQKQRVAIARALACDTPIIVADEPTGSLDSKSSKEILKLLKEVSINKLVIVVTHNKEEIENYATRLLRMHDGKLLEDKIVKKVNLDNELNKREVNSILPLNKLLLGIRNTFNIPIKFVLMFIIFLLITITLITNYGIFKSSEYESTNSGYTDFFLDDSDTRVIVTKPNKEYFNQSDYDQILSLENIDTLVENDLLIDYDLGVYSNNFYIYGSIDNREVTKVDLGRLPEDSKEIVIVGSSDNWYINSMSEDIFNEVYTIDGFNGTKYRNSVKVVGIIYDDSSIYSYDYFGLCLSEEILKDVTLSLNERYTNVSIRLNNNYILDYLGVKVSDKVPNGEVYISEYLSYLCENFNCLNNEFSINTKNIYVNDTKDYKVSKVYNSDNVKNLLGISYEEADGYIFMNRLEYNNLFNKGNYQSSIYVKELKDLDKTVLELNNLGYNTLKLKDAKYDDAEAILQVIQIFKLIVTVIVIIALFFITYFIIRIIYKSRNSYYTTLRSLGATKGVCINILMKELITLASSAYMMFIIFIILVNKNIIAFEYFKTITKYVELKEYILVYLILILLSILMASRYGRKIFKQSIMKTYGEKI